MKSDKFQKNSKGNSKGKSTYYHGKTNGSSNSRSSNRSKRGRSNGNASDKPDVDITQHPAWYTRIPGLAEFIGRIPFNMISNLPLKLSNSTAVGLSTKVSPEGNTMLQPNIVTYYKDLVSPLSYKANDARSISMNQFSQLFFTKMREANMSNMPYDPSAVTLMVLNMALGFNYVNLAQRTYGMLNYYNSLNRAFPIYLAKAMNLNYEDFRDNMPKFQTRLNMLIHRFDAMRLPRGIDLIEKIATQYSNYYIDTTDARDTLYIPLPGENGIIFNTNLGLLKYVPSSGEFTHPKPNFLPKNHNMSSSADDRITVTMLMDFIEEFVNNILASQDFGRIQGDLAKAFGSSGYYTLEPMPSDYSCAPTYDEMALMQLHNADLINSQAFVANAANEGKNAYYIINSSTGKPAGSWIYDISTSDTINKNARDVFNSIYSVASSDTSHGTWPTTIKTGISDRYMCLNPDQVSAEHVIEFSRNKGPWGVDTVSSLAIWIPLSDSQKTIFSSLASQNASTYDAYYFFIDSSWQHIGYLISLGASTVRCAISGSGIYECTSTDFFKYIHNSGIPDHGIPDNLRSIVRFLPYQIVRGYMSETVGTGETRSIASTSEFVSTFAPVVQPVTNEYLDILGLNCWMSLLEM